MLAKWTLKGRALRYQDPGLGFFLQVSGFAARGKKAGDHRAPAPPAGEPGSGRPDRAPWRRPRGGEEATCPAPAPAPQVTHRVHPGPTLRCPGPALRPSAAPSTEILAGWGLGTRSQSSPTTLMRPTCSWNLLGAGVGASRGACREPALAIRPRGVRALGDLSTTEMWTWTFFFFFLGGAKFQTDGRPWRKRLFSRHPEQRRSWCEAVDAYSLQLNCRNQAWIRNYEHIPDTTKEGECEMEKWNLLKLL
jgi:hypothetical protein